MIGEGWKEEDMEWIDEVANSPGQPPPLRGQGTGRSAEERRRYEGEYQRVSVPGAQPETERDESAIPTYVTQRNMRRKAETALRRGEEYDGPGADGERGKGKGKDLAKRSSTWSSSSGAGAWWTTAGSTWWNAWGAAPGKPEPKEFDYSFYLVIVTIFMCGALLGVVIGYLLAYIK